MNLQTFIHRIQISVLLTEERKKHFLSRAENYTPEVKERMIKVLEEHEKKFLKEGNVRLLEIKQEQADALHKR